MKIDCGFGVSLEFDNEGAKLFNNEESVERWSL